MNNAEEKFPVLKSDYFNHYLNNIEKSSVRIIVSVERGCIGCTYNPNHNPLPIHC